LFDYINKGAGKTIIPISKHYEYDITYNQQKKDFDVKFISSASPNSTTLYNHSDQYPNKNKKLAAVNRMLVSKFTIPFMLLGTNDFHGGNKIVNLKKLSGYGIDFSATAFVKSYNKHAPKISKTRSDITYSRGVNPKTGEISDKFHRYYQMLFFYNNFLKNNKGNFKAIFDETSKKFIKNIQREYLAIPRSEGKKIESRYKFLIDSIQTIAKNDYGTFIRNLIKVVGWTEDQMKEIDKIAGKKNA
jgi:hypothetical protein